MFDDDDNDNDDDDDIGVVSGDDVTSRRCERNSRSTADC